MRFLSALLLLLLSVGTSAQQLPGRRSGSMIITAPYSVSIQTVGPITSTLISGNNGTRSAPVTPEQSNSFITSLYGAEEQDDPCYLGTSFAQWSSGTNAEYEPSNTHTVGHEVSYCSSTRTGNRRSGKRVRVQNPTPVPGYSSVSAVHGIQVCTNNRRENRIKVKGIRIFVTQINADGRGEIVRSPTFSESFERTNCRKWEAEQRCPEGQVAVGLNVHDRLPSITGIGLRCQAIRVTPVAG